MIAAVLLAAGESKRFGGQKLLESWRGQPLIVRAAGSLLGAGLRPLVVVVPPAKAFSEVLEGQELALIENHQPERGIGHSISLGIGSLPAGVAAVLLAVADQPLMDEHLIKALCAAYVPGAIVAPRYGRHRGNPRIFDRLFFEELLRLDGDRGGQTVASAHRDKVIDCSFPEAAGLDIDRPSDFERLRG